MLLRRFWWECLILICVKTGLGHHYSNITVGVVMLLISCTVACTGFALWFNVKGKQVVFAGIGAFFTWLVYALLFETWQSNFLATLAGAVFVAGYAQIMARINKAPATIFLTTAVFPLVPGPNLYYIMLIINHFRDPQR